MNHIHEQTREVSVQIEGRSYARSRMSRRYWGATIGRTTMFFGLGYAIGQFIINESKDAPTPLWAYLLLLITLLGVVLSIVITVRVEAEQKLVRWLMPDWTNGPLSYRGELPQSYVRALEKRELISDAGVPPHQGEH